MNPLENEIREVLKRREPPAGFAERVISQSRQMTTGNGFRSRASRLALPAAVVVIALVLAGATGFLMTRCASACSLGGSAEVVTNAPSNIVTTEGGHSRGQANAEIVLEEWGDYQCPACDEYNPVVEDVIKRFPNQLRFEFHHFPLIGIHANALNAAIAAEAAGEQNHFWEMHSLLFQHQREWAKASDPESQFVAYAEEIGLDLNQFKESLQSPEIKELVLKDRARGQEARIEGTPAFFVNGKAIPLPATAADFAKLIEGQISRK